MATIVASSSPRDTKGGRIDRSERAGKLMSLGLAKRYPLTSCANRQLVLFQPNRGKHDEGQARRTLSRIHKSRPLQPSSTSPVRPELWGTAGPYSVLFAFSFPPAPLFCAGHRSYGVSLPEPVCPGHHRWFPSPVAQERHDLCSLRRHHRLGGSGSVTKGRIL